LYQNDDLGKGYLNAFKAVFGDDFARRVVLSSYELSEPTIESHIVNFKSAGAEALFIAGTGSFAAQAIRRSNEIGWKPLTIINFPSGSTAGTIVPAGVNNSVGVVTGAFPRIPATRSGMTTPIWRITEPYSPSISRGPISPTPDT
jgi:branched-chain amino acid transport system substrate-binding protein